MCVAESTDGECWAQIEVFASVNPREIIPSRENMLAFLLSLRPGERGIGGMHTHCRRTDCSVLCIIFRNCCMRVTDDVLCVVPTICEGVSVGEVIAARPLLIVGVDAPK